MNENHNNTQCYEYDIELIKLLKILWKQKIRILLFTLSALIIAAVYSIFILEPSYDTNLNIIISMPEVYTTRYGEYALPLTTNEQYVNLITSNNVIINTIREMGYNQDEITIEKLKEKIHIEKSDSKAGTIQNSFVVTVSSQSPSESVKLAQTLYDNYIEFLDAMIKERAINYFYNYFNIEIKAFENLLVSEKEILRRNEELLVETPKTVDKGEVNLEIKTKLTDTSDYIIPIDIINPNYIKLESDIVANKQSINEFENTIKLYKQYINEINLEKQSLNKYYETGRAEKLELNAIGIIESNVYLPSPPVEPTEKTSPRVPLITFIGATIGTMIGIIVILVKNYWSKYV